MVSRIANGVKTKGQIFWFLPWIDPHGRNEWIRLLFESSPGQSDKDESARLLVGGGFWLLEASYMKDDFLLFKSVCTFARVI